MTTLFISDLHLAEERSTVTRALFDFLSGPARRADALYILGDLFDAWPGDDDVDHPFHQEVCRRLRSVSETGVSLFFLPGNRDFLAGEGLARACAMTLLADPTSKRIEGWSVLLMHGDTLCTGDVDYQAYRRMVREPEWQEAFLARPLAERKQIIAQLRSRSEVAKRSKAADIMDVHAQAVDDAFRRFGYPLLIHGHTHRPAHHSHHVDERACERWVLPDWEQAGGWLELDGTGARLLRLPAADQ